jgi:molecular chaperone GrpE (heat shock protein)
MRHYQYCLPLMLIVTLSASGCGHKSEAKKDDKAVAASTTNTNEPTVQELRALEAQEAQKKEQVVAKAKELEGIYKYWKDTIAVAASTPRGALSQPVLTLQQIRRDTEQFQPVACLQEAQQELLTAMQITIDDYIAFMSQDGLRVAKQLTGEIPKADDHFVTFESVLGNAMSASSLCLV